MAGVMHVSWYATLFRGDSFAEKVTDIAELSLRFGARKYQVHRNNDDRYKLLMMVWCDSKDTWYQFWESPELIEFRARNSGHYQVPINYAWHEDLGGGELGPMVNGHHVTDDEPQPQHPSAVN